MQKIKYANGSELAILVANEVEESGLLEIQFAEGVSYEQVRVLYDAYQNEAYSEEALRRMEFYGSEDGEAWELQGVHNGYTDVRDISALGGRVTVTVGRENPLVTEVAELRQMYTELASRILDT